VLRSAIVDAIHRSPDNQHAVFAPIYACGDLCHTVIWLIRAADGKRVKLGEGGPDVHVAWHPNGGTVAVGSASLWIISLADFKVKAMDDYRSPAYSPDGVLYVRDERGSAFTIGKGKPVKVWDSGAGDGEGEEEEEMDTDEPKPVDFVNGKPKFDLDWYPP
jgi:hypothetical protein